MTLERFLTAREVADLLGMSPHTILDWSEDGRLPSYKIGAAVRFRTSEVTAWLEGQRRPATSPLPTGGHT